MAVWWGNVGSFILAGSIGLMRMIIKRAFGEKKWIPFSIFSFTFCCVYTASSLCKKKTQKRSYAPKRDQKIKTHTRRLWEWFVERMEQNTTFNNPSKGHRGRVFLHIWTAFFRFFFDHHHRVSSFARRSDQIGTKCCQRKNDSVWQ